MWTTHFQFNTQPFDEYMPAERLWPDERLEQGLARLDHLVRHGAVGLITGATGLGKSALIKRFLQRRQEPGVEAFYLHLTRLSAGQLLKLLAATLGEVPLWGKDRLPAGGRHAKRRAHRRASVPANVNGIPPALIHHRPRASRRGHKPAGSRRAGQRLIQTTMKGHSHEPFQ